MKWDPGIPASAGRLLHHDDCGYTLHDLRKSIPVAFQSVPVATIKYHYHHCVRTIEGSKDGFQYGTKEFVKRAYKSHRQVVDKSKW